MSNFTKRHYEVVAHCIAAARVDSLRLAPKDRELFIQGVGAVMNHLMDEFAKDNALFTRFAFLRACTKGATDDQG